MNRHYTLLPGILFAAFLLAAPCVRASSPEPSVDAQPRLKELLRHLQENLWEYRAAVPDFFADEHIVSSRTQRGTPDVTATSDSTFRLVRSHVIGDGPRFIESRVVRMVNHNPIEGRSLNGPAIFSGGFSIASGVVSQEMARCFNYTLEPDAELDQRPALVVRYRLKQEMLEDDGCPGPEAQSGRAWIDPAGFHLMRMEMTIPNHLDNTGNHIAWVWSADFTPVTFDGQVFWIPKTIESQAETKDGAAHWSFTAEYTNYHKVSVRSHIITSLNETPAKDTAR
ncbi:MAG: hypothetical protein PW789_09375 [Edaphobacter sp.]|uniref:hypothetical protein n=1 Tax=Edaphobacter sp. TaxID=1934404 RepID=UPI002386B5AD|nr:hypothetical protein [Edaphobacter sp.]MDE1176805.1 hypothetical protein [Edaphobacter sp.]